MVDIHVHVPDATLDKDDYRARTDNGINSKLIKNSLIQPPLLSRYETLQELVDRNITLVQTVARNENPRVHASIV